eukprot:TRINITY_DN93054_c0_g1_i1.p1 TRINITY_DN93054_c0_g1~~TRINITY_DN93054_c0_g1_i1.p1  ORF type:complete len:418 (+),score=52.25 TRINITY_DN93054_c0_g1_i1:105-1256(+)
MFCYGPIMKVLKANGSTKANDTSRTPENKPEETEAAELNSVPNPADTSRNKCTPITTTSNTSSVYALPCSSSSVPTLPSPNNQEQENDPQSSNPSRNASTSNLEVNRDIDIYRDFDPPYYQGEPKGSGATGQVWKTYYQGKPVAVKVFNPGHQVQLQDAEQDDFVKEVDINLLIRHENVVKCYGACVKPGKRAIVMECMDEDLEEYIYGKEYPRYQRRTTYQIVCIVLSIAKGLQCLHEHNIVHRDLHTKNVLISKKKGIVKVADFGISHILRHTITFDNEPRGIFDYIAPEVSQENRLCTYSDIYSLAMILYELWHMKRPWEGYGEGMKLEMVKRARRPVIDPEMPDKLRILMEMCWKQDYNERPTAKQVADYCRKLLKECQ